MKNEGYELDQIEGIVPVRKIIAAQYKNKAEQVAAYLNAITLKGNVTKKNRSAEDVKKDQEAIQFLNELAKAQDPALAYGFMIYNETGIMKQYWSKRVGKLRKNKTEFFNQDVYLDWISNVFEVLNGTHEYIHQPLYYYRAGGTDNQGNPCGDYDVMNSFRTHWNMYCLPILAKWLFKQDQLNSEWAPNGQSAISIEGSMDNEDAGHHLDAEMAASVGTIDVETEAVFEEVEEALREMNDVPWTDPISPGSKAGGVTYHDFMVQILGAMSSSAAGLRKDMNLSQSVYQRAIATIKSFLDEKGITLDDLGNYISHYPTVGIDILTGHPEASFRKVA